jgi:hypothetical protein
MPYYVLRKLSGIYQDTLREYSGRIFALPFIKLSDYPCYILTLKISVISPPEIYT